MRIDAHHHFWQLERDQPDRPASDLPRLQRDFGPSDLKPHIDRHHVKKTILVQAQLTPSAILMELAKDADFVAGVVGVADLGAANAGEAIETLAGDPLLVGLQPTLPSGADGEWSAKPGLVAALAVVAARKLVLEIPSLPRQNCGLLAQLDRYSDIAIVVDHGAKSFIRDGLLEPWRSDISAIAKHSRAVCKLSGLVAEIGENWRVARLRPYVEHLLNEFGPERLLWGSDWPVVDLAGGYDRWMEASEALLGGLDEAQWNAVFGDNARRIYLSRNKA
jgi:L-fuconolactonase